MQGYHGENYPGNSKEILKNWKHGTQDIKMAGPFANLVCILNTFTPKSLVSWPRHHLRTLLHNNKLLIEKLLSLQLFTI